MEWVVILLTTGYGLFSIVWPDKVREMYLSHFEVDEPAKWYKPNTYLTFRPPAVVFRLFGVVLLGIGIFLIFLKYSRYAVFD